MTMTPADPPTDVLELSLVRDDLPFRLQRRLGLVPAQGLGLVRRAAFWSLLAWLPIALWAVFAGRALPGGTGEPLLSHFGIHVRFLVAIPLLILAEGFAQSVTGRLLPYFVHSGVVPQAELANFRTVLRDTARLRDASMPWILILGIALAAAVAGESVNHAHEIDWAVEGDAGAVSGSFGALWFLWVGRPIYLALVLGWVWRVLLLFVLFRRIAALELSIVATHPDRTGGLAFVEHFPTMFAPVALAAGAVLASGWAHDAVYHGLKLPTLKIEMIAFVAIAVVVFLLPLTAFQGPLKRTKKQALLSYGALAGRHGALVRDRWIDGKALADDAVLNAPELGPVADVSAIYVAVKDMRTVPFGKTTLLPIALAAALPMIAVLAIQIPMKPLLLKLLKALL